MYASKLIYNGVSPQLVDLKSFSVGGDIATRISSANWSSATDALRIEFAIDRCGAVFWQPVMRDGAPLKLSAALPRITLDYPGLYRLVPDPAASTAIAVLDQFQRSAMLQPSIYADMPWPAPAGSATPEYDRPLTALCDPATGKPVFVAFVWPELAGAGTVPTVEYYNAAGATWTGSPSTLVANCASSTPTLPPLITIQDASGTPLYAAYPVGTPSSAAVGNLITIYDSAGVAQFEAFSTADTSIPARGATVTIQDAAGAPWFVAYVVGTL